MATGRKASVRSVKGSDLYYEFPCSACEKDGRNVEAIKYCGECDENLCGSCLTFHQRLAITRDHKLSQVQTGSGTKKTLPSRRCSKHGGKPIDVFCPKHNDVGCSVCIAVDHSSCDGKQYIPDVASGIKTSKELRQLEQEMKTLDDKLRSLKKLKRGNLQRLQQDKEALIKQIHQLRKKMNDQLDKMEKTLVDETERKFKENIDAIHNNIQEVDAMLEKLKQAADNLKSDQQDADIFISCKSMKQMIDEEIQPMHDKASLRLPECRYELKIDEDMKMFMEGKSMLASINELYALQEATLERNVEIKIEDDSDVCRVYFMTFLPDGCLVMSDYGNKKLKKLDVVSYNVSTMIKLPGNPLGVCLIDNTRLAVCLAGKKEVQIVSLSGRVSLADSFSVGDRCRGLAHCDGLLYVCCGGSQQPKYNEGKGHVEVYNYNGTLLRCFYEDCVCPLYLSVVNDGGKLKFITSDFYQGVVVRDGNGVVKETPVKACDSRVPFCIIGTDQLCIGEYESKIIYTQTGNAKQVLIKPSILKYSPRCVYFDTKLSRLFVVVVDAEEKSMLEVFQLM